MTIFARLYQHPNFGGRSSFHSLIYQPEFGGIPTYGNVTKSAFDAWNMHDKTSSLQVTASDYEQGGNVILFQKARYKGRYALFQCTPGQTIATSQLSSIDFDNRTSSALLVRGFRQECPPIPISILFSELAGQHIAQYFIENAPIPSNSLGDRGYRADRYAHGADPIFTWDMWPSFSPSRTYAHLRVPIRIVNSGWYNYDVELRFWIYLYIDSRGALRGYVDWYGARVEGMRIILIGGRDVSSSLDDIMNILEPTALEVNRLISEALSAWEPLTFERLYYLPGRSATGHVNDGVHLVLVQEV